MQYPLRELFKAANVYYPITLEGGLTYSGGSVTTLKDNVDAWLAGYTPNPKPEFVPINIGRNAPWSKTDLEYVMDAVHVKWPSAKILVALIWWRGGSALYNPVNTDIAAAVAARSPWAATGADERIFLEGGDDGVLETVEGTHYTVFGAAQAAAAWKVAMGFW
jgi:hypothetical protein